MRHRNHYHVYVIELSKDVLYEGKFRKANPDYVTGKPCVYVGMTGLDRKRSTAPPCQSSQAAATALIGNSSSIRL